MKRYGIIGAGISGLTMAYKINRQTMKNGVKALIQIFEIQKFAGGRVMTKIINKQGSKKFHLDIGANLIDFQSQESLSYWSSFLPEQITKNLRLFQRPFLIYQNYKFRKGDYQKNRYYFNGGFPQLIQSFLKDGDKNQIKIFYNHQVEKIQIGQTAVNILVQNKENNQTNIYKFDKIYVSCPGPNTEKLLANSLTQNSQDKVIQNLLDYSKSVKYTKQLSVGFQTDNKEHFFSSILFKNHPVLSFICSHQQKYKQNTIVAQIGEQFSQKYFNEDNNLIGNLVYESLPEEIKIITKPEYLIVHRWPVSLIKNCAKNIICPSTDKIQLIGDFLIDKSRVTNAVYSTIHSKL